ncbi:MAG TPA: hypothetical protein VH134_04090 [Candidatus Dormibacteraeota bacterium]|jgi:hypothetical protein|nr:hypothetical protein [Candidatus Dormibacteraeota bacterium]
MSVVHLSDLAPSDEPSMSPDGRWAWDGGQWRPLFSAQPPVRKISYVRVAAVSLVMSFAGCLGAVYTWEIVVLQNLRGHLGIP